MTEAENDRTGKPDFDKIAADRYPFQTPESSEGFNAAQGVKRTSFYNGCSYIWNNHIEQKWISVDERLPEFNKEVLCRYAPTHPIMQGYKTGILKRHDVSTIPITNTLRRNFDKNGFGMASEVKYWMHLPEPPKPFIENLKARKP